MNDLEDLCIARIVDRTASQEDWVAFEEMARLDPSAWERLHGALQDDLALRREVQPAFDLADAVELPPLPASPPVTSFLAPAGWLAALVLALLWVGTSGIFSPHRQDRRGPQGDEVQLVGEPLPVVTEQKDPSVVLEELPPDVWMWQPREDGSVELVWLRRTVERTVVDTVYRMAEDELGNSLPTLVDVKKLTPPRVY